MAEGARTDALYAAVGDECPGYEGGILPMDGGVASLLSVVLGPLGICGIGLKLGGSLPAGKSVLLRPPSRVPGHKRRCSKAPDNWDWPVDFHRWSYWTPRVSRSHNEVVLARSIGFLPDPYEIVGPRSSQERGLNDMAVSNSADCVHIILRAVSSVEPMDGLGLWYVLPAIVTEVARMAVAMLPLSVVTEYYSLHLYLIEIYPYDDILHRLYREAPTDRWLPWARAILGRVAEIGPTNYGVNFSLWLQGPASQILHELASLMIGYGKYYKHRTSASRQVRYDEAKLWPLLKGENSVAVLLFAIDISEGPILEAAVRAAVSERASWQLGDMREALGLVRDSDPFGHHPLRNIFCTHRGCALESVREVALSELLRVVDVGDLQGALDFSLDMLGMKAYQEPTYTFAAAGLCISWSLVERALVENPTLTVRIRPKDPDTLKSYLELGRKLKGRVRLLRGGEEALLLIKADYWRAAESGILNGLETSTIVVAKRGYETWSYDVRAGRIAEDIRAIADWCGVDMGLAEKLFIE